MVEAGNVVEDDVVEDDAVEDDAAKHVTENALIDVEAEFISSSNVDDAQQKTL